MASILIEIIRALWFIFPAYVANASPMLAKGVTPIDMGRNWVDGKRIFGDGKTWRGFFLGVVAGTFYGSLMWYLFPRFNEFAIVNSFSLPTITPFIAFVMSLGALTGDLVGSFIKRRLGKKRGEEMFLFDTLNFVLGAIVFTAFFSGITLRETVIILVMTPIIHRVTNIVAYQWRLKRVPW